MFAPWGVLWLFLCRKCSYEKPGMKLLTLVVFLSGISILKSIAELVKSNFDIYDFVCYAIYIPIFIWFVITSSKLIEINKKIRDRDECMQNETVN